MCWCMGGLLLDHLGSYRERYWGRKWWGMVAERGRGGVERKEEVYSIGGVT